jgi:hypothetical protein
VSKLTTSQKEQLEKLVLTATVQRFIMAELQRHVQLTNSLYELYRLLPAIATVKFDTGINSDSLPHLSIRQGKDESSTCMCLSEKVLASVAAAYTKISTSRLCC